MAGYKWEKRSYRASMTDMTEYRMWLYNKAKNMPYSIEVEFYKRDSGAKEYGVTIQGLESDSTRGFWVTRTFYSDHGTYTTQKEIIAKVESVIRKVGTGMTHITYNEWFDWREDHPIKKHRRVGSDWGIYATNKNTSESGWFDKVYGSLTKTNKYATRYSSKEDAQKMAANLNKNNPMWKFEVKQMGKLDA